ncbi:hypothetical protein [Pseudofrankia inefficax]|uniref:Uncharacterized protein n=1 Tax=Pseudofrankia inefficax (strain DSM 45817 / CECT 9037 / DDB 130130 / EuI1c) TaxID=298654 RepID=E3IXH4_PSEI1|nr:hypothetical protein [Pseudofrankia inefficax]ADP78991.1 hypothetical protein FraEuI1c_0918 [Pseudofrankia inefficax]
MTAPGAPAGGGPRITRPDDDHSGRIDQAAATGSGPAGAGPEASVGERPDGPDARVLPLRPRSRGRAGGSARGWVFHGEVETITGPEADRIRAELADVLRDLLLWAAGHDDGGTAQDGGPVQEGEAA